MENPPAQPQPQRPAAAPRRQVWPWLVGVGCLLVLCGCIVVSTLFWGTFGAIMGAVLGPVIETSKELHDVASREYPAFEPYSYGGTSAEGVDLWAVRMRSKEDPRFLLQVTYRRRSGTPTWTAEDDFFRSGSAGYPASASFVRRFASDFGDEKLVVTGMAPVASTDASRTYEVSTVSADASTTPSYDPAEVTRYRYAYDAATDTWLQE